MNDYHECLSSHYVDLIFGLIMEHFIELLDVALHYVSMSLIKVSDCHQNVAFGRLVSSFRFQELENKLYMFLAELA
jgi:hypothetical protein